MAYVDTPKPSILAGQLPPTTPPPAHVLEKHQPHGPWGSVLGGTDKEADFVGAADSLQEAALRITQEGGATGACPSKEARA